MLAGDEARGISNIEQGIINVEGKERKSP